MMTIEPYTAEREWTVEGVPVLTAAVSLPQPVPAESRTARRIRRYYQSQCRAYLRYCEKWLLPQARTAYHAALASSVPLPVFRAELDYRVTYQDDRFWSLYTQSREVTERTLLTRRGDTWDLTAGYPAPLSTFLPPHAPWRRWLTEQAAGDIRQQETAGVARYHPKWPSLLRRRLDPKNFYLTEEGLAFFYPMYAIAPAAEGIPTFLLPYGDRAPAARRPEAPEQHPDARQKP